MAVGSSIVINSRYEKNTTILRENGGIYNDECFVKDM